MNYKQESQIHLLKDEYEKRMRQLQSENNSYIQSKENDFKTNLDMLESEFKKVLVENTEKFK